MGTVGSDNRWRVFLRPAQLLAACQMRTFSEQISAWILPTSEPRLKTGAANFVLLANVVLAVDHGQIQVAGFGIMDGRVFYLVFEMAESDLRCQIDETKRFDVQWCMHALRDVILIVPDEVRRLRLRGTDVDARAAVGRFR
jgi:hypothetical protein